MNGRKIFGGLAILLVLSGGAGLAHGQVQPVPQPVVASPYVPITVVVNLDAVKAKVLQEMPAPQQPPGPGPVPVPPPGVIPPPPEPKRPLGGLLKNIIDRKPLQTLLAVVEKLEVARELEKISQPVNLGGDLWLSLNFKEIVVREVNIGGGFQQMVVGLSAQMEPTIVLSKEKPLPSPLPQFTLGGLIPPPPPGGTPMNFLLKVDPRSLPQVLPDEVKKELDKYGIDVAKVGFGSQPGPNGPRLLVTAPMTKPLTADLTVLFTPQIKNNVLTFVDPESAVILPPAKEGDNGFKQTLQKLTQDTIRGVVVNKLKETTVDLGPYLKAMANLPLGQPGAAPGKVQAPVAGLRVEEVSAWNNHLIVGISGTLARNGIVVFAP